MESPPARRVSHPILRLDVLDADGWSTARHRVFCRIRRESVDVGHCCSCAHCDEIVAGPAPSVDCTAVLPAQELTPDPHGDRTEVGVLLKEGTCSIASSAWIHDALALVRAGDFRTVPVVGGDCILVGVLHEARFPDRCAELGNHAFVVSDAMSSPLAIHESTPVRDALRFLARAHLREAAVVTSSGIPLGIFRDVDGLRWIAESENGLRQREQTRP